MGFYLESLFMCLDGHVTHPVSTSRTVMRCDQDCMSVFSIGTGYRDALYKHKCPLSQVATE